MRHDSSIHSKIPRKCKTCLLMQGDATWSSLESMQARLTCAYTHAAFQTLEKTCKDNRIHQKASNDRNPSHSPGGSARLHTEEPQRLRNLSDASAICNHTHSIRNSTKMTAKTAEIVSIPQTSRTHRTCCRDITVSARVQLQIDSLTCGRNSACATPRPLCPARVRILTGCVVAAERPSTSCALSTPPIQVHACCPSRGVSLAAKRPHGCIMAAECPSTQCAQMASLVRQRSHGASSVSQTECPHRCIVAAERPSTQYVRMIRLPSQGTYSTVQTGAEYLCRCIVAAEHPSP